MRDIGGIIDASTTVEQLGELMDRGEITALELTWYCLEQIARNNENGLGINAIAEINPDVQFIAESLDVERREGGSRGPLHGIPVLLKDNIDTGDKMHTTAGTLALAKSRARHDAFMVARLRCAGAVILGKTNLSELANFLTDDMPNGYSARGGKVHNPYGPGTLEVSGSSSGSAAAVAAGFVPLAVGTETSGSILSPASNNSVVGIKPTVGLVSRSGIIPISTSQDTAGPMARTVADAAAFLGAMVGVDRADPATRSCGDAEPLDYRRFLNDSGLRDARIGVPRSYCEDMEEDQLALVEGTLDAMRDAGATVIDPVEIAAGKGDWQSPVLFYEFKPAVNAYLDRLDPHVPVHSLAELIHYNFEGAPATIRYGQSRLLKSEATSGTLAEAEYLEARKRDLMESRTEGIDAVMAEHRLDALLFAANKGSGLAAKAGYPSITVPAGYDDSGLPLGITFTARAFEEPRLIELGYAFEMATKFRRSPVE